jgi:hypothetical protein
MTTTTCVTMVVDAVSGLTEATTDWLSMSQVPLRQLLALLFEKGALNPVEMESLKGAIEAAFVEMSAGAAVDRAVGAQSPIQRRITELQDWLRTFNELNGPR